MAELKYEYGRKWPDGTIKWYYDTPMNKVKSYIFSATTIKRSNALTTTLVRRLVEDQYKDIPLTGASEDCKTLQYHANPHVKCIMR